MKIAGRSSISPGTPTSHLPGLTMALWRIFPSAEPEDPRWQDRGAPEKEVLVRAPSAAMARLLAGRAHATSSAGTQIGNESSASRGLFQDEKLYWVARMDADEAAMQGASADEPGFSSAGRPDQLRHADQASAGSRPAAPPAGGPSSGLRDDLMRRTIRKRVTFPHPFPVIGLDDLQPAGTYSVEIEEELLEGLSFPAYRRLSTNIILPPRPDNPSTSQVAQIDPGALDLALDQARADWE
jgi:hypothetical protein